ncbi:MAG: SDR family oxidoreductase [Acidobacteriota bacterium]
MTSRGGISGKVALVTGGGTGIGRATAMHLSAEGARVVVAGRRIAPIRAVVEAIARRGGEARAVSADVSTEAGAAAAVEAAVGAFRRLDLVVNAAGVYVEGSVTSIAIADWRAVLAANLDATFLVSRFAMAHLARRGGVIVNLSSTLATRAIPGSAAYGAAKAGVENLTRAMAIDHARDGVRVVAVAPAIVATAMGLRGERRKNAALRRELAALHPIGRLGRAADVAALVVQLCRPESSWITGTVHTIDGGLTAKG